MTDATNIRKYLQLFENRQLNEGVGKSPTVSAAYGKDQEWWRKNGGDNWENGHNGNYDNDGYDSYGYNESGKDRADHSEEDYMFNNYVSSDHNPEGPDLPSGWFYDNISGEWTVGSDGKPIKYDNFKQLSDVTTPTIENKIVKNFKQYVIEDENYDNFMSDRKTKVNDVKSFNEEIVKRYQNKFNWKPDVSWNDLTKHAIQWGDLLEFTDIEILEKLTMPSHLVFSEDGISGDEYIMSQQFKNPNELPEIFILKINNDDLFLIARHGSSYPKYVLRIIN